MRARISISVKSRVIGGNWANFAAHRDNSRLSQAEQTESWGAERHPATARSTFGLRRSPRSYRSRCRKHFSQDDSSPYVSGRPRFRVACTRRRGRLSRGRERNGERFGCERPRRCGWRWRLGPPIRRAFWRALGCTLRRSIASSCRRAHERRRGWSRRRIATRLRRHRRRCRHGLLGLLLARSQRRLCGLLGFTTRLAQRHRLFKRLRFTNLSLLRDTGRICGAPRGSCAPHGPCSLGRSLSLRALLVDRADNVHARDQNHHDDG